MMEVDEITIRKLINYVLFNAYSVDSTGLYNGKAGFTLCLFEVGRKLNDKYLEEQAFELLQESLLTQNKDIGFENGLSGVGYVLLYLIEHKFVNADFKDLFDDMLLQITNPKKQQEIEMMQSMRVTLFFCKLKRAGIHVTDSLLIDRIKKMAEWLEKQMQVAENKHLCISKNYLLVYIERFFQIVDYCLPDVALENSKETINCFISLYVKGKYPSVLSIGCYLDRLAQYDQNALWKETALQNMEICLRNPSIKYLSLSQTIDTLLLLRRYSGCYQSTIDLLERPFTGVITPETLQTNLFARIKEDCLIASYQWGIARFLLYWAYQNSLTRLL